MRLPASLARPARALLVLAAAAALPLGVQAQGGATRPLAGTYAFEVLSPNGAVKVQMVVRKAAAGYDGTLSADGFPQIQIARATPNDSGAVFEADAPDGNGVRVVTKIGADNRLAGMVDYSGMQMPMTGMFTPEAGSAAPAGAFDGVGRYEGATTDPFMGAPSFPFTCVVTRAATGALGGGCAPQGGDPLADAPFSSVTVTGNVLKAEGSSQMGPFTLEMTIAGAQATGTIALGTEKAKTKATFTPAAK